MSWDSIAAGLVVAGINGVFALAAIRWGWSKGMQTFMIAFFGGMIVRLIAVVSSQYWHLNGPSFTPRVTSPR